MSELMTFGGAFMFGGALPFIKYSPWFGVVAGIGIVFYVNGKLAGLP